RDVEREDALVAQRRVVVTVVTEVSIRLGNADDATHSDQIARLDGAGHRVVKRIRIDKNLVQRHYSLTLLAELSVSPLLPVTFTVPASSVTTDSLISSTSAFSALTASTMSVP